MAMLSISLGIVNLVPVPVLDGGQILFFLLEAVRGRPVSHQFRERAQQIGVLFLVALMLAVLVFDIHRLFEG
jgi:regulator of sigma E protease